VKGRNWFRQFHQYPTEYLLIDKILELLRGSSNPLKLVKMGEPPGSRGVAYRVVDPKSPELYIKVKIVEDMASIVSFKRSDHAEGGVHDTGKWPVEISSVSSLRSGVSPSQDD
jgi:hypothetical protein